jgi:metallo-beta-lactamase family protein
MRPRNLATIPPLPQLTFLGAAGTVTGSKYLLEAAGRRILVDCGLFQGYKQLRLRNWAPLPVDPGSIDAVLLTHAHLDHSGYLPLLVKNGFKGRIYCTKPTADLTAILLIDSGQLQERDAEFANRHGFSKHAPALPLYTEADAEKALRHFRGTALGAKVSLPGDFSASFLYAGHILGAAMIALEQGGTRVLFSGDLGRQQSVTLYPPAAVTQADYLVLESTYGNRAHDAHDPEDMLADIITRTAARGGTVVVPAFAVGRVQDLLVHLYRLKQAKRIPNLPLFLDSPMAIDASEIFGRHPEAHRMSPAQSAAALGVARYVRTREESKALDDGNRVPKVIISASGMATGGRVLHHLKAYASDPRNTVLFTGFQAGGTRGAAMLAGAETIKIHGQHIPVRAQVEKLDSLSAHADANEILGWLRGFKTPPKTVFIIHGEPDASDALRRRITEELGWRCSVPEYRESVTLD